MPLAGFRRAPHRYLLSPSLAEKGPVPNWEQGLWLSKKWLAPLFRGVHSSLAPTARPGSYARKPLLRKAFCGFAVHAAKSDYSLRVLRPPNPQGFFDSLRPCSQLGTGPFIGDAVTGRAPGGRRRLAGPEGPPAPQGQPNKSQGSGAFGPRPWLSGRFAPSRRLPPGPRRFCRRQKWPGGREGR